MASSFSIKKVCLQKTLTIYGLLNKIIVINYNNIHQEQEKTLGKMHLNTRFYSHQIL